MYTSNELQPQMSYNLFDKTLGNCITHSGAHATIDLKIQITQDRQVPPINYYC